MTVSLLTFYTELCYTDISKLKQHPMKRSYLLLLFFATFVTTPFAVFAQNGGKGIVKGVVIDETSQSPLDFATVSLYSVEDSALVTGGITDETGRFSVEAAPGDYYAELTFISYQKEVVGDIRISDRQKTVDLGMLSMQSNAETLAEVEVRAEKSRMQMSLDKRIFNVGKDLANTGGSALEVLDNVPSLAVDVEGNVSLRGMNGVRILIDGKPSGLIGVSSTDGLRQIPANLIERVEVITNPSARYEAEGMAGVINIILRKEKKGGLNGSFDLSGGYPTNYGAAINLNYRKEKFNFFANYGLNYRESPGDGSLYQEVYRNDTTFLLNQNRDRTRTGLGHSVRAGADYYFNENSVLTTAFTYRDGEDQNFTKITYRDYVFNFDNPTAISERTNDETELEPNLEYSMTYRKTFEDNKDHTLTFDLRYQDNTEQEQSDIEELFYDSEFVATDEPLLQQRSLNKEGERLLIGQIDYVRPFGEEGRFEAGYRGSIRRIDNDYLVEELKNDIWESLAGLSNDFNYDEDIHAAYAMYGNKYGKFSFQLGLRAEYSDVKTALLQTNEINHRDYFNLFPSAFFTYDLPAENAVQLSYSRRLNRPRFWDLNPFFSFSDARNFRSGNPNLDPEFTHSLELGHIKYWENASLTSAIYYRHTDGVIERIRTVDDQGNSISQPQNLATQDSYGLEFTFSASPYDWWDIDGNFNFFRAEIDGGNVNQSLRAETYGWFSRLTSKFEMWKEVDSQLRFNYRGPRNTPQGRDKAYYYLDLAMSKDIFNNKGTLTLAVTDVFNSRQFRYIARGVNFFTEGNFRWRNRQLRLTLNYRLNQDQKRGGGRRG